MSKGTIKYSQEFKSEFGNRWIGIDMVVNDDEDWDEKYAEAENRVHKWAMGGIAEEVTYANGTPPPQSNHVSVEFNGAKYFKHKDMPTMPLFAPIPTIDPRAYETAEIGIDNATTIQDLEFYADIAVKYGLVEMYLNKKKTLQ